MSEAQTSGQEAARELTAFQRNILTILAEEPRYGLAIKRELESYYGEEVNHGRLYPNLDDLVSQGFVEKSELDKRTNEYALTAEGVDAVLDGLEWALAKFVSDPERAEQIRAIVSEAESA